MTEIEKGWELPQAAMSFAALVTSCPNIISDSKKTVYRSWIEALVYQVNSPRLFVLSKLSPSQSFSSLTIVPISYPTKA